MSSLHFTHHVFFITLLISFLSSFSEAQCPNRCYESRRSAIHDCNQIRDIKCLVVECNNAGSSGRMCSDRLNPDSTTPSPSPTKSAPTVPPGKCTGTCYSKKKNAKKGCKVGRKAISLCQVKRCVFNCSNKPGYACVVKGSTPPTPSCSSTPSNSQTSTPSPTQSPEPLGPGIFAIDGKGHLAAVFKDPHIKTFDGFSYDCQQAGELTLLKSEDNSIRVHGITKGSVFRGTILDTIIVSYQDRRRILQVGIDEMNPSATDIAECKISLFVNGVQQALTASILDFKLLSPASDLLQIKLPTELEVHLRVQKSLTLGCHLDALIFLPGNPSLIFSGLLGSPDGEITNEWTDKDGRVTGTPVQDENNDRLFEKAFAHCHEWCITDEANSLLAAASGRNFAEINKCVSTRPATAMQVNVNPETIAANLKSICGSNPECIIDGTVGGEEAARAHLAAEAEIMGLVASKATLSVTPSTLLADELAVIRVTIDATAMSLPPNFNGFAVYWTSANSIKRISTKQYDFNITANMGPHLRSQVHEEESTNVYSSLVPVRERANGIASGLVAYPIIDNTADVRNSLMLSAWNGLRAYNDPLLGTTGERTKTDQLLVLPNWEVVHIVIVFSYPNPRPQKNLISNVKFIGDPRIATSTFLEPSFCRSDFDMTEVSTTAPQRYLAGGFPGTEQTFYVNVGDALQQNDWKAEVDIEVGAYWLLSGRKQATREDLGVVLVSAYAVEKTVGGPILPDSRIVFALFPLALEACQKGLISARIRLSLDERKTHGILELL